MGKFDGWMICSDFDGTVYVGGKVAKEDSDAIEHFQSEGGRFTFASGRIYTMFDELAKFVKPNAPLITLNGAVIAEDMHGGILYQGAIARERIYEFFDLHDRGLPMRGLSIHAAKDVEGYNFKEEDSPEAREAFLDSVESPYTKLLVHAYSDSADELYGELKKRLSDRYNVTRSWPVGIEINDINDSKGRAVLRLKKMLSIRYAVCIGDYDNDIDMIKAADIGYAVGSATDALKEAADRITVPAKDHAMAAMIAELERQIDDGKWT